jgi:hypothetical protein
MLEVQNGIREPEILNAKDFEYKKRETYFNRLRNHKLQHEIVATYFKEIGFAVRSYDKETIAILKHEVYGDVVVFFFYSEEQIGTCKKLLITRNGHKSSRQIINNIIRMDRKDYSVWFESLDFSA